VPLPPAREPAPATLREAPALSAREPAPVTLREVPPLTREPAPAVLHEASPLTAREPAPAVLHEAPPLTSREPAPATLREGPPLTREPTPAVLHEAPPLTSREPAPATLREGPPLTAREVEAPVAETARGNPYFFRDQEDDDEEELLLTIEMNDSSENAHRLVPAAASSVMPHGNAEPYLGPTRNSAMESATDGPAPNPAQTAEESENPVVESMPWPSVNDRRMGAPIPAKEHGTATPPRRSWWRRSIGRNS
jgi:hypothetical protein